MSASESVGGTPWEGLTPPYRTIVADPPWRYQGGGPRSGDTRRHGSGPIPTPPYSHMTLNEMIALRVENLAHPDGAHLYLWTTSRYLWDATVLAAEWGFNYSQTLVWCKDPQGLGPGGTYASTTEFVLFCRRGALAPLRRWESSWFSFPRARRGSHSTKPAGFFDMVELVSPGPYVELFARQPRLGWDSWGYGYESKVSA